MYDIKRIGLVLVIQECIQIINMKLLDRLEFIEKNKSPLTSVWKLNLMGTSSKKMTVAIVDLIWKIMFN